MRSQPAEDVAKMELTKEAMEFGVDEVVVENMHDLVVGRPGLGSRVRVRGVARAQFWILGDVSEAWVASPASIQGRASRRGIRSLLVSSITQQVPKEVHGRTLGSLSVAPSPGRKVGDTVSLTLFRQCRDYQQHGEGMVNGEYR